jgi:hypothetical protein
MVFVFQLFSGWFGCFEGVWTGGVLKRELEERSKYRAILSSFRVPELVVSPML